MLEEIVHEVQRNGAHQPSLDDNLDINLNTYYI